MEPRPRSFYFLAAYFGLYVLFLYGPTITIAILSFQGLKGGLTVPMNGMSLTWFGELFQQQSVGDIWGSFGRSLHLGLMVMVTTLPDRPFQHLESATMSPAIWAFGSGAPWAASWAWPSATTAGGPKPIASWACKGSRWSCWVTTPPSVI